MRHALHHRDMCPLRCTAQHSSDGPHSHLDDVGGLLLRDGELTHGVVDGVGLIVEVLHAAQCHASQRLGVARAPEVVRHLLCQRQEQRLVLQPVQVLVRVRVDHLRKSAWQSHADHALSPCLQSEVSIQAWQPHADGDTHAPRFSKVTGGVTSLYNDSHMHASQQMSPGKQWPWACRLTLHASTRACIVESSAAVLDDPESAPKQN